MSLNILKSLLDVVGLEPILDVVLVVELSGESLDLNDGLLGSILQFVGLGPLDKLALEVVLEGECLPLVGEDTNLGVGLVSLDSVVGDGGQSGGFLILVKWLSIDLDCFFSDCSNLEDSLRNFVLLSPLRNLVFVFKLSSESLDFLIGGSGLPLVVVGNNPFSELPVKVLGLCELLPLILELLELLSLSLNLCVINVNFAWLLSERSIIWNWLSIYGGGGFDSFSEAGKSGLDVVSLAPNVDLVLCVQVVQELLGADLDLSDVLDDLLVIKPLLELLVDMLLQLELLPVVCDISKLLASDPELIVVEGDRSQSGWILVGLYAWQWLSIDLDGSSDDISDFGQSGFNSVILGPFWNLILGNQLVGELGKIRLGILELLLVRVNVGLNLSLQVVLSGELLPLLAKGFEFPLSNLDFLVVNLNGGQVQWLSSLDVQSGSSEGSLDGLKVALNLNDRRSGGLFERIFEGSDVSLMGLSESVKACLELSHGGLSSIRHSVQLVNDLVTVVHAELGPGVFFGDADVVLDGLAESNELSGGVLSRSVHSSEVSLKIIDIVLGSLFKRAVSWFDCFDGALGLSDDACDVFSKLSLGGVLVCGNESEEDGDDERVRSHIFCFCFKMIIICKNRLINHNYYESSKRFHDQGFWGFGGFALLFG